MLELAISCCFVFTAVLPVIFHQPPNLSGVWVVCWLSARRRCLYFDFLVCRVAHEGEFQNIVAFLTVGKVTVCTFQAFLAAYVAAIKYRAAISRMLCCAHNTASRIVCSVGRVPRVHWISKRFSVCYIILTHCLTFSFTSERSKSGLVAFPI